MGASKDVTEACLAFIKQFQPADRKLTEPEAAKVPAAVQQAFRQPSEGPHAAEERDRLAREAVEVLVRHVGNDLSPERAAECLAKLPDPSSALKLCAALAGEKAQPAQVFHVQVAAHRMAPFLPRSAAERQALAEQALTSAVACGLRGMAPNELQRELDLSGLDMTAVLRGLAAVLRSEEGGRLSSHDLERTIALLNGRGQSRSKGVLDFLEGIYAQAKREKEEGHSFGFQLGLIVQFLAKVVWPAGQASLASKEHEPAYRKLAERALAAAPAVVLQSPEGRAVRRMGRGGSRGWLAVGMRYAASLAAGVLVGVLLAKTGAPSSSPSLMRGPAAARAIPSPAEPSPTAAARPASPVEIPRLPDEPVATSEAARGEARTRPAAVAAPAAATATPAETTAATEAATKLAKAPGLQPEDVAEFNRLLKESSSLMAQGRLSEAAAALEQAKQISRPPASQEGGFLGLDKVVEAKSWERDPEQTEIMKAYEERLRQARELELRGDKRAAANSYRQAWMVGAKLRRKPDSYAEVKQRMGKADAPAGEATPADK